MKFGKKQKILFLGCILLIILGVNLLRPNLLEGFNAWRLDDNNCSKVKYYKKHSLCKQAKKKQQVTLSAKNKRSDNPLGIHTKTGVGDGDITDDADDDDDDVDVDDDDDVDVDDDDDVDVDVDDKKGKSPSVLDSLTKTGALAGFIGSKNIRFSPAKVN